MEPSLSDYAAIYGAFLSTALAIAGFYLWFSDRPKLSVHVFNPNEYWVGHQIFGFAIVNIGRQNTVVSRMEVVFRIGRSRQSKELGRAVFDQSSRMNPASRTIPDPNKPNSVHLEPRVLSPGSEYHGSAKPVAGFDPQQHWIEVTAYARGRTTGFRAIAAPVPGRADEVLK